MQKTCTKPGLFYFILETETSTKKTSDTLDSFAKDLEKVADTLSTKLMDTATTKAMAITKPGEKNI